ncbi:MAG: hypothetical protein A2X78_04105 [Gammaproteobacteria bacterium GWE2_37_16]|nr:MAG: hypothetical protein A2X78_04105 [Gammaproteobacteria bacterium GWE2_37_16]
MDDQLNKTEQSSLEYHLPEDMYNTGSTGFQEEQQQVEDVNSTGSAKAKTPLDILSKMDVAKFRPLFTIIGLLLAIFVLYKLVSWNANRKEDIQMLASQQGMQPNVPITKEPVAVDQLKTMVVQEEKSISQISVGEEKISGQLNKIADTFGEQQTSLNNLNKAIGDLTTVMALLSKNVDEIVVNTKKPEKKIVKKVVKAPKKIIYHVKSIVPGRAWLESTDGQTVSVRVGNLVNGSRVGAILSRQGMVLLNSGEVIQYGTNDI